jgi:DNA-binding GntR family transcriptional regulator
MQRDGGYLVLLTLIQSMQRDPDTNRWHANAQPHRLSKQFRVSRGTVRNALADCADQGWIVKLARGGHDWLLTDAFVQQCRRWAAYEMVWTAQMANAAYMRLASHSEALLERKVG